MKKYLFVSFFVSISFFTVQTAFASSFTQSFSDDFNRADGAIGNGWQGATTTATISSDELSLDSGTTAPWENSLFFRPLSEVTTDQRASADFAGSDVFNASNRGYLVFRIQNPGDQYITGLTNKNCDGSNPCLVTFVAQSGTLTKLGSYTFTSFNSSHTYRLDTSVEGTNPSVMHTIVTDLSTDAVVASSTETDSTADLQQIGKVGMFANPTETIDNFVLYKTTEITDADSYTLSGPSTADINEVSGDFTVTPDGSYTGTITPSDGGAGGTFTPSSLTFSSSSVAKTFTYTPIATGLTTISVSSNPTITNPDALNVTVTDSSAGAVSIENSQLYWSPYTWRFNGNTWAQTTTGGGSYIKIAFTGSKLGVGIDTSNNTGADLSTIHMDAYIDGTTSPIAKSLANISNNVLTFTNSLSEGNHYAIIYFSQSPRDNARWIDPKEMVRITKVQLATDGSVRSLSDTPIAVKSQKVLIYGDSITEGVLDTAAENAYSAVMAKDLDVEYGQVGYGSLGWSRPGKPDVVPFYNLATSSDSSWRNYDQDHSRLVDSSDLSSGFIDGTPNAVFVNLGINDANLGYDIPTIRTKVTDWLQDIRQTVGPYPSIFIISPFNFGDPSNADYKAALFGGVSDYEASHSSDKRIFELDLGYDGWQVVVNNSDGNGLHPNDTGAAILGDDLAPLASSHIPLTLAALSVSEVTETHTSDSAVITWKTNNDASTQVEYGSTISYGATTTETDTSPRVTSHSVTLSDLQECSTYHYRVLSTDDVENQAVSSDASFTTSCAHSGNTGTTTSGFSSGIADPVRYYEHYGIETLSATALQKILHDLLAQVVALRNELQVVQGSTACMFGRDLYVGMSGDDVTCLQEYLNGHGFVVAQNGAGSPGNETSYFGLLTKNAMENFQEAHKKEILTSVGLKTGTGYFGASTRAYINAHSE